jgi:uncharacterized membrane protein YkoI
MHPARNAIYAITLVLAMPVAALAQLPAPTATAAAKPKHETQAELQKQATVTLASATATALKTVPGATVKSHELEREKGKLIYSFEMKTAGKSGIDEVNIDALTGVTVGKVEHEADPAPKKSPVKTP